MRIGVVYSPRAGEVDESFVELADGSSVIDAIHASGLATRHQDDDILKLSVGVWGRRCEPSQLLDVNDRVEVYRPLRVDPKEARRLRYRNVLKIRKADAPG